MRIKSVSIDNFKAYPKVKINCNENFNFIVGENNVGKSTLLEALQLWKVSFDCLVQKNHQNFYGTNTPRYLPFENLFFLRLSVINDVFNIQSKKKLTITVEFSHGDVSYPLKISLEKPGSIDTYFRVKFTASSFKSFRDKIIELGLNLNNAIYLYQTKPVFHSTKNEPFYNNAQLLKKISLGKSHEVIRNKLLKCENGETKFKTIEDKLENIFKTRLTIRRKNKSKQDEEYVRITIQEEHKKEVDLSLVGSGILQVLEILSTLEFINRADHCLNILLIDEPDSHVHSNLQSALIDELRSDGNNQVFLISHNDRLIQKADEGELFFLNNINIAEGIIKSLPKDSYSLVVSSLAGTLLSLSEEEESKIIVITEGKTDKKILETAWVKLYEDEISPFLFVSSGLNLDEDKRSGNADFVRRTIELVSTISNNLRLVGLFDNDREGNEQFKGVNKNVFEQHSLTLKSRKHVDKNIYALLLPVPSFRASFITANDLLQRYFVIEHYFGNEVLDDHSMKGPGILGTNANQELNNSVINAAASRP
jgi:AAA15 family ATPase/GTPase